MTEEKKQELRQLLEEAQPHLKIRDQYYGVHLSLPEDLYREYLQESWKYFGLDCFSPHWIRLSLDIACASTKSRLLDFIREELAQFLGAGGDTISASTCLIETTSPDCPSVCHVDSQRIHLELILTRLLDIALVRGIGEAVSVFHRCSRPEGTHVFFQDVALVEGVVLEKDLEVSTGVSLVPLNAPEISRKLRQYLPRFPHDAFIRETSNFGGKTLLVIERPGFSIFHERGPAGETPLEDLPLQIGEQDVIFRTPDEINSFQETFIQALSLILDHGIQIIHRWFCLGEAHTFNLRDGSAVWPRLANQFSFLLEASEADIEETKCLHKRLVEFNPGGRDNLQKAIDRWIKSKSPEHHLDNIVHLGIALEALYVSESCEKGKSWQIRNHASAYLREDQTHRAQLETEFRAIYNLRSDVVHNRQIRQAVEVGGKSVPVTNLVRRAQDSCRETILKILEDGRFPDWAQLIQDDDVEKSK